MIQASSSQTRVVEPVPTDGSTTDEHWTIPGIRAKDVSAMDSDQSDCEVGNFQIVRGKVARHRSESGVGSEMDCSKSVSELPGVRRTAGLR